MLEESKAGKSYAWDSGLQTSYVSDKNHFTRTKAFSFVSENYLRAAELSGAAES